MYGGLPTAAIFPFLVLWLRFSGYKVVVTIHSVVLKKEIDKDFIALFNVKPILARPFLFKIVFSVIYFLITKFANKSITHTKMMKKSLIFDYHGHPDKIEPIPTAVPSSHRLARKDGDYFFYFGYLVRRKGLGYVLDGFSKFLKKRPKSKYKFIMAGGAIKGQEKSRDEILQSIKEKGLGDKVKYVGFIDQKQQDELYSNAYAIILPAKISIAASGPLYWSYSYRRCPIASDVGNLREEIIAGKTGILTPNSKWDQAFEFAVNNPKTILRIEGNIEEVAKERSPENTASKYANIYHKFNSRKK